MISNFPGLQFSSLLFAALLRVYSREHRTAFSEEMNQVFRDLAREIYEERGLAGLLRLWSQTLFDLMKTAMEERLKELAHMTKERFIRVGGWSLVLAGLMVILFTVEMSFPSVVLTGALETMQDTWFYGNSLLYAIGLFALRARFQNSMGPLGNASILAGAVLSLISFVTIPLLWVFLPPRHRT